MSNIGGLFGRSAAGPLEEIALKTQYACELIPEIIDQVIAQNLSIVSEKYKILERLESEVDDIKDAIRERVSPSIFKTAKRLQILEVVSRIEEIADCTQAVGRMVLYRNLDIPLAAQSSLRSLSNYCMECGERMANTVGAYRVAEQQRFSDSSLDQLYDSAREVSDYEHEADKVKDAFQRKLFENEQKTDPVSVILLMQLTERLDQVCNACENAVGAIMRLVMRH